jgi:hypothetical protein
MTCEEAFRDLRSTVDRTACLFSLLANTVRTRRVLSLFTAGQTILGDVFASLHLSLLAASP